MKKIWSASAIVSAILIVGASCAPRVPPRPPKPPKPPRPPHGPNVMDQRTIIETTIAYPHK